jgi:hypothetical protein
MGAMAGPLAFQLQPYPCSQARAMALLRPAAGPSTSTFTLLGKVT